MGEHPVSCRDPECDLRYVDHLRSIAVSAHATPNRRPDVVAIDQREARWDKDMPAYKALRRQGYQPPMIDGCHTVAQGAQDRHDIEGTARPVAT